MSYELEDDYPLQPEVDRSTDLSKGLRRSMPTCYDELGRYKEPKPFPIGLGCLIVIGLLLVAKVVL